jgi:hypothetical protein
VVTARWANCYDGRSKERREKRRERYTDPARAGSGGGRVAAGTYRITFNRNVSGCAYSATIDLSGVGEGHAGEVYVDQTLYDPSDPPSPRQVDVITFNSSGTSSSDNQFDLIVHC